MGTEKRPDEAYFQIGEAADRTSLTQRTLRYYEEKGLLHAPDRMDGGFRLYSQDDLERIERIKEMRDLLGFSLADIKEMLEADDIRLQIRAEWRKDADAVQKAARVRVAREATLHQLALIDDKVKKMETLRAELTERLARYDAALLQWSEPERVATSA